MSLLELVLIAVGLAMDAFAVSICKGLTLNKMEWNKALLAGGYFAIFQMIMPIAGFYLGYGFRDYITAVDHWIAFALLAGIGIIMIRESSKEIDRNPDFGVATMLLLSIATSIDALAVGVSFAFLKVNIWEAVIVIGIITFILSAAGVKVGNVFGSRYKAKAEIVGGIILILIGIKILLEHLEII